MIYSIALFVDYIVTRPAAFRKGYSPHTFCTPVHKLDSGQAAFAASVTQTKRPPVSGEPAGVFLFGELLVYRVPDDGVGVENSEIPNFLPLIKKAILSIARTAEKNQKTMQMMEFRLNNIGYTI